MTDPEHLLPPRPPVIQISPTEMRGAWPDEVRHKLHAQGLDPALAARVAAEVARLAPAIVGDPGKLRAAARLHLLLGLLTVAGAVGGGVLNSLRHAFALVYLGAGAAAAWGTLLCCRGLMQWRLSRSWQRRA